MSQEKIAHNSGDQVQRIDSPLATPDLRGTIRLYGVRLAPNRKMSLDEAQNEIGSSASTLKNISERVGVLRIRQYRVVFELSTANNIDKQLVKRADWIVDRKGICIAALGIDGKVDDEEPVFDYPLNAEQRNRVQQLIDQSKRMAVCLRKKSIEREMTLEEKTATAQRRIEKTQQRKVRAARRKQEAEEQQQAREMFSAQFAVVIENLDDQLTTTNNPVVQHDSESGQLDLVVANNDRMVFHRSRDRGNSVQVTLTPTGFTSVYIESQLANRGLAIYENNLIAVATGEILVPYERRDVIPDPE